MASPALRRPYRREGEEKRRDDLIAAAMTLVAEGGPEAATVRAIAARAGVTPGLIRHYFQSKEELTHAAYRQVMDAMTHEAIRAWQRRDGTFYVEHFAALVDVGVFWQVDFLAAGQAALQWVQHGFPGQVEAQAP